MTPHADRAQFSHTLPRNFTFHYDEPRTPEPLNVKGFDQPPEIPRQTFKLKRRRAPIPQHGLTFGEQEPAQEVEVATAPAVRPSASIDCDADTPLPSIEVSRTSPIPCSPPRTPVDQMLGDPDSIIRSSRHWEVESTSSLEDSASRPTTASDASFVSSLRSYQSYATGFTSPGDYVAHDFDDPFKDDGEMVSSPLGPKGNPSADEVKSQSKVIWSSHMDLHLWFCYMRYLSDPTHTPHKIQPETAPPFRVQSRVAREAKRTWRGPRPLNSYHLGHWSQNDHSRGADAARSGSTTPTAPDNRMLLTTYARWPRSDVFVRKRLKFLCRHEKQLHVYYRRLMQARTPSPSTFRSSSRDENDEPTAQSDLEDVYSPNDDSAFSTRDMNISLTTSTSGSMAFGAPLNKLATDPTTPRPIQNAFSSPARHDVTMCDSTPQTPDDGCLKSPITAVAAPPHFAQLSPNPDAPRPAVHQKAQSIHFGYRSRPNLAGLGSPPKLGSPFAPGPSAPKSTTIGVAHSLEVTAKRPTLGSPLELAQPIPKRRVIVTHLEPEEATEAKDCLIGKRAGRFRGFSMNHASQVPRRGSVMGLFEARRPHKQTSPSKHEQADNGDIVGGVGLRPPAQREDPPRLASPFQPEKQAATLPPNFLLHSHLDPMSDAPTLTGRLPQVELAPRMQSFPGSSFGDDNRDLTTTESP